VANSVDGFEAGGHLKGLTAACLMSGEIPMESSSFTSGRHYATHVCDAAFCR